MTINYKDSKRIIALSTESLLTSSDYTSSNFTTVGSTVAITNNSVVFSSTPCNADNGQHEQITALAESDVWSLDFIVNNSSGNTYDNVFLGLSSGSSAWQTSGQNEIKLQTQGTGYMRFTLTTRISGSNSQTASSNNSYSYGTDYYCTLSSDGTDITFKVWTNSGRTGTASVTLTRPVSGLGTMNYIQHRSRNAGDSNTWSGTVSEVALSRTPAKPTNVQDNSILVEKDTARRYWFGKAPVATDDYTSNKGYVKDSSSNWVLPTGGKIDFETITRSTTAQFMYIDLQDSDYLGENLSDTNYTVRFGKFKVVNEATASGNLPFFFALSNNTGDSGVTQQAHTCQVNFSTSAGGYTNYCTTGNLQGTGASQQSVTGTAGMADGDERYIEMSRSGNDFTVKICSDANYSIVLGSGTQTVTGISGLRYLKFINDSEQNQSPTASAELFGGLEIINGADTWTWSNPKPIGRAIFASGVSPSTNVIDYITIATTGNATDFGDSLKSGHDGSAVGSILKAVFGGGTGTTTDTRLEYISFQTLGNAVGFGAMTSIGGNSAACGDGTRGIWGQNTVMEYITIDTPAASISFGTLGNNHGSDPASCADSTRGVWGGGEPSSDTNAMSYVTIQTLGNSTDFGDLTVARRQFASCANATRGVWGGGYNGSYLNTLDYATIQTPSNASDFGDLTQARVCPSAALSDATRGVWAGGGSPSATHNIIDYITIDTTGNATDFGDLTVARNRTNGASDYVK